MPSPYCCSLCCTLFSFSGFVFSLFIGSLIKLQPLYIPGVVDPKAAAIDCFGSAGLYAAFLVVSAYWFYCLLCRRRSELVKQMQKHKGGNFFYELDGDSVTLSSRSNSNRKLYNRHI